MGLGNNCPMLNVYDVISQVRRIIDLTNHPRQLVETSTSQALFWLISDFRTMEKSATI